MVPVVLRRKQGTLSRGQACKAVHSVRSPENNAMAEAFLRHSSVITLAAHLPRRTDRSETTCRVFRRLQRERSAKRIADALPS